VLARGFGPMAERWVQRVPRDCPIVVCDTAQPQFALAAAAEARLAGTQFYGSLFMQDARSTVAMMLAPLILAQHQDLDARRTLFDQLAQERLTPNGLSQRDMPYLDASVYKTMAHFYRLLDTIVVRSWAEYSRLGSLFQMYRAQPIRYAPPDPDIPKHVESRRRDTVVVWGGAMSSEALSIIAFALDELKAPTVIVSADGKQLPLRAMCVRPEDGPSALAAAMVIVAADELDPGVAISLASHGVPIVTPSTSGAHEFIRPSYVYEPWDWRTILRAVLIAMGSEPGSVQVRDFELPPLLEVNRSLPTHAPLVSLVTPTMNRRDRLPRTLEQWSKQRYPNFEHILVNDGGEPIDDIVAKYPFARVINLEENVGIPRALNRGVKEARGEYLLLCADDDVFAPDHIANLVAALEQSGGSVAHTNVIVRHEEDVEGSHRVYGYSLDWCKTMDKTAVQYTPVVAITGLLTRRSAFDLVGQYDESLPQLRDYALIYELSKSFDFIHVDTSTAVYSYRSDPSSTSFYNRNALISAAIQMIYDRNPVDRPTIQAGRVNEAAHYKNHDQRPLFEPAMRII
jgi:hypothetical protein